MIRGTTEQFKFQMPYEFGKLCWIEVTFWQPGHSGTEIAPLPFKKVYDKRDGSTRDDGFAPEGNELTSKTVIISLTDEETRRFTDKCKGYVQVMALCDKEDIKFGSKPTTFIVYPAALEDTFDDIGQSAILPKVQILDAGELK